MSSQTKRHRISILIDPRFPGGTTAAVAREILALSGHFDIRVFALETRMFKGRQVNLSLQKALERLGLDLVWNPKIVRDEIVVFHNLASLKFNEALDLRVVCDQVYVVTHENFLRPNGTEGFDVPGCLKLFDRAVLARTKMLGPVSGYNRLNVTRWLSQKIGLRSWEVAPFNWFNICDFEIHAPTKSPRDRRGRLSRAGFEKFAPIESMYVQFPPSAESCTILGGDSFLLDPENCPEHWEILPFNSISVDDFFKRIDFFVYFTHPHLRESFGRVIPEAIAAGKVVITDKGLHETFGDTVVCAADHEIDDIIEAYIEDPKAYVEFVKNAQQSLSKFYPQEFRNNVIGNFEHSKGLVNALL